MFIKFKILSGKEFTSLLIYLFVQVPVGTLPSGMKLGFLEMESLTSHNQFLLGLGINSDNHNSLLRIAVDTATFTAFTSFLANFENFSKCFQLF